uniref:SOSEKI DIX-like domain-containing protein n=1 Tax=Kalanchoe fedtschenkoi TaxID=63787 RepID=A0A7N0V3X9_KALFE
MKPVMRKVPVVYYLPRNGQVEHPHFMEVILSAPNLYHLHLKDVMERLTALRGPDMPARYSWSCKRSYKNGYVWKAENDVIWPAEGADEYVLKGSELVHGHTDKTEALHIIKPNPSDFHPRAKQGSSRVLRADAEKMEEEEAEEENSSNSLWTSTPPSRFSVGISTDDIHLITSQRDSVSQPQVSTPSYSDKDIDPPVVQPGRNSVLLQLIACGSSTIAKCGQRPKQITLREQRQVTKCNSLKGVVEDDDDDGVAEMIECMLANPRFGGFQTENKEYFSGSIVEAMAAEGERAEAIQLVH